MFAIPQDIVKYFFDEIHAKGKYEIKINGNSAKIIPRREEESYKPIIDIKNIEDFRVSLYEYINALNEFYLKYNVKKDYHDLSYFFNNLIFNMTFSDSEDLTTYIYKRITFFQNEEFNELEEKTLLLEFDNVKYYVKRVVEAPGLETPFILIFEMEYKGVIYPLPLIRYAFDENNICHLFAIQFGKDRIYDTSIKEYKDLVNEVNSGVNKFRNVSPSFVLSFTLFLKLLNDKNIKEIMVPSFLFARYKHYHKARTVKQSDLILNRILNNFILLLQRMEYEIDGFNIYCYTEEFDSYTHITLEELNSKNRLVRNILKK